MIVPGNNLEQQPEGLSYRDYARNARLLRALPPPPVPQELKDPAFLETIYERAAADDLGTILAEALPPRPAPEEVAAGDVVVTEAADRPELAAHFQVPAGGRAPGWLWQRIQADLRQAQAGRRRQTRVFRLKVAAAAAVLLLVGAGVSVNLAGPGSMFTDEPEFDIQVQPLAEPLGQAFHPMDRLLLIAGGR